MNTEHITINFLLFKWKITLLVVFFISIILSFIFSSPTFIKPLFKSSATLYPVNLMSYSDESPTEQFVQLLYSKELKKQVVGNMDLISYYKIDSTDVLATEKAIQKFEKRVKVRRTQFESVEIEVLDHNATFAYNLLVNIIESYNKFALTLVKERANEILVIKRDLYFAKVAQMDSLKSSINSMITNNELIEYNLLKESMYGSFSNIYGNNNNMTSLRKSLTNTSLDLFYYETALEADVEYLAELKNDYLEAINDANKQLEFANIISYPDIANKKVYPIRWLICLISAAATLFFTFTVIILIERKK